MPSTSIQSEQRADPAPPADITISEAFLVWLRIALLSFGGPAGQIALMHRELVEERRWIGEERFLHALNYCMLLPGPEAQQLAIYIGWLMHRTLGGLIAGLLFILPGALVMLGFYSRIAAFICSGEMAFAYFIGHFPKSPLPVVNGGFEAILFCFVFLYVAAAGPGAWSIDGARLRNTRIH